jgi:large conductance mechanosensitive channel
VKGFKDFVMRGNVVDLAVAVVIGTAFAAVVKAMVDLIMGIIGKLGGQPDFNAWQPGGLPVGAFITALISFLILAAVVYFLVVKPYELAKERLFRAEPDAETVDPNTELLKEIRDELRARPPV